MRATRDERGALDAAARAVETRRAVALAVVVAVAGAAARAKRSAYPVAMLAEV